MSFGHISHLERNYSEKYPILLQVLWPSSKFLIKCIILGPPALPYPKRGGGGGGGGEEEEEGEEAEDVGL